MANALSFTKDQLPMSASISGQILAALGTPADNSDPLQDLCDAAAADVARLTLGYVIDQASLVNWAKIIATYRAYGLIGPVQPDVEKNFNNAWQELTEISQGKRPNIPKTVTAAQQTIAGAAGSGHRLHGRLRAGSGRRPWTFPGQTPTNDMNRVPTLVNGLPNTIVGPPTTAAQGGPWSQGDTWIDSLLAVYTCTLAGTPGAWLQVEPAITNNLPANPPLMYLVSVPNNGWAQQYWNGNAWVPVVNVTS